MVILTRFPKVVVFDLDSTIWDGDIECMRGPPFKASRRGFVDRNGYEMEVFRDCYEIMGWLQLAQSLDLTRERDITILLEALPCQGLFAEMSAKWESNRSSTKKSKKKIKADRAGASDNRDGDELMTIDTSTSAGSVSPVPGSVATIPDSSIPLESCVGEGYTRRGMYMQVGWASRPFVTTWSPEALGVLQLKQPVVGNDRTQRKNKNSFRTVARYSEIYPGDKTTHLTRISRAAKCNTGDMVFYDNERRNIDSAETLQVIAVYAPRGLTWANFLEGLFRYGYHP